MWGLGLSEKVPHNNQYFLPLVDDFYDAESMKSVIAFSALWSS